MCLEDINMNETILNFFCECLKEANIPFCITSDHAIGMHELDLGLRNNILKENKVPTVSALEHYDKSSLYHFSDFYNCSYSFFQLPDERMLFVGPYLLYDVTEQDIHQFISNSHIPETQFTQLRDYYYELPLISDKRMFWSFLRKSAISICNVEEMNVIVFDLRTLESREDYLKKHAFSMPEDPLLSMNLLEKRYKMEDEILDAISHGNTKKALSYAEQIDTSRFSPRSEDALRSQKNLMLSFNTLLRRSAYEAGVHPLYIDVISSNYARLIEAANSKQEIDDIAPFMLRSYSELVEKRSTALYSEPIRQILVTIDASIASDLSLKRFANELFLNTSYLSSLFKKETGMTLTDYVNQQRITYAKRLLKSTTLSIQGVATSVGIPDIHYFTRLFRRDTGMSPRDFRKL